MQINENVRGQDVFVIQPTCPPVNDHLMELLVMLDAFKRASAGRITAVLPYYGYGRQDRKVMGARADHRQARGGPHHRRGLPPRARGGPPRRADPGLLQHAGGPPLRRAPGASSTICAKKDLRDPVLVSPDAGGVERARAIAKRLNAGLAIIDKRRDGPNVAVFMHLIGDVEGKDVVIIDDMIDTAGTLIQAVDAVRREGARRILAAAVHGVLSGPAIERIDESDARRGHHHQLGPADAGEAPARRSTCSRWRRWWRRRSAASTTRSRCRRSSC